MVAINVLGIVADEPVVPESEKSDKFVLNPF